MLIAYTLLGVTMYVLGPFLLGFSTDVFVMTANPRTLLWPVVSEASGLKDILDPHELFLLIHMRANERFAPSCILDGDRGSFDCVPLLSPLLNEPLMKVLSCARYIYCLSAELQ